ncbi:prephenate dehydratase [Candidatus Weimeria sp. HCP3S3_B5]|uniref:prephenate dehydratase n=1 Tax=Candidatus Weimeria sp. HCP3S3_B5 TaxID=3438871 RepID=UPI003F8922E2
MEDLTQIRQNIDDVDNELLSLFKKRLAYSCDVAEYKIAHNRPVMDKAREEAKIAHLTEGVKDSFMEIGIREFFSLIMSISRKKQYQMLAERGIRTDTGFTCVGSFNLTGVRVVYQGVEGAYSQAATNDFFGKDVDSFHVATWRDAMDALREKKADYAVLPIENSTAGTVSQNLDLLSEYDCAIIGEEILKIDHALLGTKDATFESIKHVYSHPQALMQCASFLRCDMDGVVTTQVENTALAAQKVKEDNDPTEAAIAGSINASLYDLQVIKSSIQDEKDNETRFIIVSAKKIFRRDACNISICFTLPNQEGSLYGILTHFAFNGINMSRIESRPLKGRPWEYRFFVDFEGNLLDEGVINALVGLSCETDDLKILGNY